MRPTLAAISLVVLTACGGEEVCGCSLDTTTTTPAAPYSTDAVEAIQLCVDELGPDLGPAVEIDSQEGHTDRYMSLAAMSIMVGGFMGGEQARLQAECDEFTQLVDDALRQSG